MTMATRVLLPGLDKHCRPCHSGLAMASDADTASLPPIKDTASSSFLNVLSDCGSWCVVALLAILPYYRSAKSLEEAFIFGPTAILILTWLIAWCGGGVALCARRIKAVPPFIVAAIVVTVVTALVSVRFSLDHQSSVTDFKHQMMKYVLTFMIALSFLHTPEWRRRAYCALFVTGVGAAVFTLVGYY